MLKLILAAAIVVASVAPAFAQYECYVYKGRMVCCTKMAGGYTFCN